ncbi:alpha/beta hydrolase fold domain-containing protein [Williamsia sp.]|uniref:alpha/beta hydrolase fold domain-containing protein n=1 Tax=Williamsia sp. TaxID=1872085 RepID=UPI001A1D8034|nr:alpha/beta hydrolase fold domain-containing protein [Williamsia sp.]MBJ7290808.1 alpha/beta hydrolase [Williamsia sp.]
MRKFSRILAAVLGVVVMLYTVVAQLLALTPVPWMAWILQAGFFQTVFLAIGTLRDSLGMYNVLLALISVALIMRTVRPRRMRPDGLSRRRTITAGFAGFGLIASVVTCIVVGVGVAQAGAGFAFFTPLAPGGDLGATADRRVVTGSPDGTTLHADLYQPNSRPGPHPVVVFVHGGAFVAGKPGPNPYNRYLADHGYAVLDVEFRLASDTVHNWDTQVGDVGCALTWLTRNGAAAGLDTDRVVMFGESSGGNLAINAAYMTASKTLDPTCGRPDELPKIVAAVGGYPAVDLTTAYADSAIGKTVGQQFIGGSPEQFPERYRFVDSANHITPQSPPTLIVQGGADHLVLAAPVERFADKVRAAGVPTRYVELPALEHGIGDTSSTGTAGTITLRHALLDWLGRYAR